MPERGMAEDLPTEAFTKAERAVAESVTAWRGKVPPSHVFAHAAVRAAAGPIIRAAKLTELRRLLDHEFFEGSGEVDHYLRERIAHLEAHRWWGSGKRVDS